MITAFVDPFEALDARLASDWLQHQTTSEGPFPPINVFQQGGDLLAIIELPSTDKSSLQAPYFPGANSLRLSDDRGSGFQSNN